MRFRGILERIFGSGKGFKNIMSNLRDVLPTIKDLEPSEDRILWRYMDLPSLIEILTYKYLPLIRVSGLSDPAEGAMLKFAVNKLELPNSTNFGRNLVLDLYQRFTYISSWCASKDELAPMWERFSPRDGVAIKTSAKRLMDNLVPSPEVDIKRVEYIDKDQDDVLSQLNSVDTAEFGELHRDLYFYKMSDFMDEREIRIVKCLLPWNTYALVMADGPNKDSIEQVIDEIMPSEDILPANIASMNDFIIEIVISPTARPGIFKVLNNLLQLIGMSELSSKIREYRRKMWF